MSADPLPSELLVAPLPLIGFSGLDVSRNAVHKSIWEAFSCNRKPDRAAVQFKILPANYEFPVAKPKRASYEWYHPKGILKRNWMLKHLHVLPAFVVMFQEMEWNDPLWSEKQLQCVATLQSLKNALQERNTRICLVLLQKSAPLPPGEDVLAAERAASLTAACGINNKMLYILPHTEHLMGYILRLESAFVDMAQTYYSLMSKRIRTHRDQLTAAHTTLKIRHQFKLGFVAEIRQDFSTALKHYTQAYATLDEIRITDTNCLEIKTVAGFLNYKMCRLMFKLKVPRDAINGFIAHIDKNRNRTGFKDLIFEHHAWLSTQHSMFAELFCEAIKNGLPALQTQHPGIYFHKAAEYVVKRREAFLQSCAVLLSPTEAPINLQNNNSMSLYTEFFGMRAVKTGEPNSEQQMNMLIRETEKSFNHSSAIINLLGQAMAQYKIYKCLRFRKKLAVDMAEEYYKSGDHAKALTLYSLMLPDYRQEKWCVIYSDVLLKTLRCALLAASLTDYIACSVEALSLRIRCDQKERIVVLENLWKVYQCTPPISQSQIAPEIQELWEQTFTNAKSPIHIDLDKLSDFVELCATFERDELMNDEIINLRLIVKVLTDVPIKMRNFVVLLSDGVTVFKLQTSNYLKFASLLELRAHHESASEQVATPGHQRFDTDLKLEPGMYYNLYYTVEAQQFLENTQLHVVRVEVQMGSDKLFVLFTKNANYARRAFCHHTRCRDLEDNIDIHPVCRITPTFHLNTHTNLDHDSVIDAIAPTMLVNEYFPVITTVSNQFNVFLQNVGLSITVPEHLRNRVFLTTEIAPSRQKLHANLQIDIGELSMHASTTVSYYIFSLVPTLVTLQQKLWYTLDVPPNKPSSSSSGITIITINGSQSTNSSADNTPDTTRPRLQLPAQLSATGPNSTPVVIEFVDEQRLRKTREQTLSVQCEAEIDFTGRFYTLSKKPLTRIYRGENFLFRANIEVCSSKPLEILETYFICDHNLVQSTYSFSRKKHTNKYEREERLEDVIVLRTNATLQDWVTSKEYERSKGLSAQAASTQPENIFQRLQNSRRISRLANSRTSESSSHNGNASSSANGSAAGTLNKSLMAKIPNNMTIVGNRGVNAPPTSNAQSQSTMLSSVINSSIMTASTHSDDGKFINSGPTDVPDSSSQQQAHTTTRPAAITRVVYNKAIEAVQATGHCRGFIRNVLIPEPLAATATTTTSNASNVALSATQSATSVSQNNTIFGVYCIKWRRHSSAATEDNESRFVISGLEIEEPPLNIYASIEERMFVKMPMTFKVVLKNPTAKVLHLIAILSISNADNFICSGHKQLDLTICAYAEKELLYNLYPLCVGWQQLPELTLEYNTQSDPSKDEAQNNLLAELVQRAVPKKVFVLPPLKQLSK